MENLPVFLRLAGKRAAVVGGGGGAARRVETLARAGAQATVFAATLDDEFRVLREGTGFQHVARDPTRADLDGFVVCYVATGDAGADARVFARVRGARALINVADQPDLSDFIAPSIVDRAPLVVAISTGGAAPMLARLLKARLESAIPSAAGRLAAFMGKSRALVGARLADARARRRLWSASSKARSRKWFSPTTRRRPRRRWRAKSSARRRAARARRLGSLSRRRRSGRSGPADLPRASLDAEGRCRALRSPGQPGHRST